MGPRTLRWYGKSGAPRCRRTTDHAPLQRIRCLVQPQAPDVPAPWERVQPVRAVALALEAAGIPFCAIDDAGAAVEGTP